MRIGLIGNPENRRVSMFCDAALRLGFTVECISWLEVLRNFHRCENEKNCWPLRSLGSFDCVRIEALGENEEVQHEILRIGGAEPLSLQRAQIGFMDQYYDGFCAVMQWLAISDCKFQNSPKAICSTFDKWESAQQFAAADLPRPKSKLAPQALSELQDFRQHFGSENGRMFLKPRYSSSASGVCAYRWQGQRQQLIAPIEIQRSGNNVKLFNSLKVRSYTRLSDIQTILAQLLPQRMIAERWVPKLNLNSRRCDLRIVVVGGEARHLVVRKSATPMTNLHLGNERGTLAELEEEIGAVKVDECRELAVAATNCFPGLMYAGVDIIVDTQRVPYVCEINSFGDLLPEVIDRGESTYDAIIKCSEKRFNNTGCKVQLEA